MPSAMIDPLKVRIASCSLPGHSSPSHATRLSTVDRVQAELAPLDGSFELDPDERAGLEAVLGVLLVLRAERGDRLAVLGIGRVRGFRRVCTGGRVRGTGRVQQ